MKKPVFLLLLAPAAHAAVISETFDTYPGGSADNGWSAGWINSGAGPSVVSTDPLDSGGSYLSMVTTPYSTTPTNMSLQANRAIRRQLDSSVIDTTQAYTVTWDFRIDSLTNADWSAFNDRIHFMANSDATTGTSTSASWIIGAVGDNTGGAGGHWYFFDNNLTAVQSSFANGVSATTVPLTVGDTFRFLVDVDPASRSYSASVTNLDTSATFSADNLGFRSYSTGAHQNLVFGTSVEPEETRTFSMDSLTVTGVPEPTTALLGAIGALALLRRRR